MHRLSPEITAPTEDQRIAALLEYDILDSDPDADFDELTELASEICGVPISVISLVDSDRQWFKSRVGIDATETPREISFCTHALSQKDLMIVNDALEDERFRDNPLVKGDPNIRFYAGAPLITSQGYALGTLCVIDRKPRELDDLQRRSLITLSRQAMKLIEMRHLLRQVQEVANASRAEAAAKEKFLYLVSHDLRGPLSGVIGMSELLMDCLQESTPMARDMAEDINTAGKSANRLLQNTLEWAMAQTGDLQFNPEVVDVDEMVREVFDLLGGQASEKSIRLEQIGERNVKVFADAYMLFSILQNLVSNAVKFTESGFVRVVVRSGDEAKLAVIDSGVGMSDEKARTLLSRSVPESTVGTGGERGSGIGLMLCREFIEKNGGTLSLSTRESVGTAFHFTLPTTEPVDARQENAEVSLAR